jgi:ubiquinone/menaquinone biosynthesis C-methylase UbiE
MSTESSTIDSSFVKTCKTPGWKRQFGKPTGVLGSAVGHLMAFKNYPMNRLAVECLGVQPNERVLEIGIGPGTNIPTITKIATNGFVAGVDISKRMLEQAKARSRRFIREGRVDLRLASVANLPYQDESFTKVFAVNSFHHWPHPSRDLEEVKRVLKKGGLLLLCLRGKAAPGKRFAPPGFTEEEIERLMAVLQELGFLEVRAERFTLTSERAICIKAHR